MAISSTSVSTSSRITIDGAAPGALNMERDLDALQQVVDGTLATVVRIYRFVPLCISLGRHQNLESIDTLICDRDGIDVVQRPTGGGAVLHADDLTYSLSCHERDAVFGGNVEASCRKIHGVFVGLLDSLGIETKIAPAAANERSEALRRHAEADCFANPARGELCLPNGLKILGSAQMRYRSCLMQHGSLVLRSTPLRPYLKDAVAVADSRMGGIGDRLAVDWNGLAQVVAKAFELAISEGRT